MQPSVIKSNLEKLLCQSQNILLLQGPVGDFFQHLRTWLSKHGKEVFKLNFNYGDEFFYPEFIPNTFKYCGIFENFSCFLSSFIASHNIDTIVCFGDTRPYHKLAKTYSLQHPNISFWVFEEGYYRPFFVTLEKYGVNAFSQLPRDIKFFQQALPQLAQQSYYPSTPIPTGFHYPARQAILYYSAMTLHKKRYPYYIHHREASMAHYIQSWGKSGIERIKYWFKDKGFAHDIASTKLGRFFVLPLQVYNDSQVCVHSDFSSVQDFLRYVLNSFVTFAPNNVTLIVKHHPMDRGFIDYQDIINEFINHYPAFVGRIFYIHDVPMPILLRYGVGMVTLNSTSGLSALIHNMPVKTLGHCSYNIPKLTDQQPLEYFWHNPQPPNARAFHAYRMYHMNVTQINGNFYSKVNLPNFL